MPNAPDLTWIFPLPRPHTGIPLGNGTQGLLVWGSGNLLRLTVSHAGFWDHRGARPFQGRCTFPELRTWLERGDEEGLKQVFGSATRPSQRSHQLGGGRIELQFGEEWRLHTGILSTATGLVRVVLKRESEEATLVLGMARDCPSGWMRLPETLRVEALRLRPAWDWIGEELLAAGCTPPRTWCRAAQQGFLQPLPDDAPLAMALHHSPQTLRWSTQVAPDAEQQVLDLVNTDPNPADAAALTWWRRYWEAVPEIRLPDPVLQEMVDFGLYLQACCTPPEGVACTLQGPFMEDTRLPPWSNDYHFNINIQMIYTPALASNRLSHFAPLTAMLRAWLPQLRAAGEHFFGLPGAVMLPHAVDDRGQVVGSFWTGTIDHACTAWMALLLWDLVRYGGDADLLQDLAFPLLEGSFLGYWAMAEDDGDTMHLPVTVSPEYKGARMDAWGADASFQLAACHAVLRALPQAAARLGRPCDPRWETMRSRLPLYTSAVLPTSAEYPEVTAERILLWRGQDLDASHRHHSHLAGLTPFRTLDPVEHRDLLRASLRAWQYRGAGAWSGWAVPWAASLHAYHGEPEAAVFWLHTWRMLYTNQGRASLHDAAFPGVSTLDRSSAYWSDTREVMQLDGRFGALSAVFDLLFQEYDGEIRVLPSLPRSWHELSFRGILAPGGFLLDALVRNGVWKQVRVTSLQGGTLRLRLPNGENLTRQTSSGQVLLFESSSP